MTASNVVRFRVKPGHEKDFVRIHDEAFDRGMPGVLDAFLIKTGEREFCVVARWPGMAELAAARPVMIGMLDSFRHMLEDLGGGKGVTDPVSGEIVAHTPAHHAKAEVA